MITRYFSRPPSCLWLLVLLSLPITMQAHAEHNENNKTFAVTKTEWKADRQRLVVKGTGSSSSSVKIVNAYDLAQTIGASTVNSKGKWTVRKKNPNPIPCRIRATVNGNSSIEKDVTNAPADCAPKSAGGGNGGGNGGGGGNSGGGDPANVSINSTSQNGLTGSTSVPEQSPVIGGSSGYQVFGANDLGMHCADLDTRISSILPPFNVMHAQVVKRGNEPDLLDGSSASVWYSAASNPDDPALLKPVDPILVNPATGAGGVVYKTNFWDTIAKGAYDAFYPPVVTPLAPAVTPDKSLPAPDLEALYPQGGTGTLTANQQAMPGINGPYSLNDPQQSAVFAHELPFFVDFPFGYRAEQVNWFEAAGISLAAFDDYGRENAYPLMRLEARDAGGNMLATQDVVTPISGEANCQGCHGSPLDISNGAATKALSDANQTVVTSIDDPQYGNVPMAVSLEYAADINILKLHDLKQGTSLISNTEVDPDTPNSTTPFKPVVCQACHYSPALDLAHVGPKGPGDADANGRDQTNNQTMSRVMHTAHADVKDLNGSTLFPAMPPPVDANGNMRNVQLADNIMEQTCFQCHPGKRTQCLRGAMYNGGMRCQDCHGDMKDVGDDFSRSMPGGSFELASDFYSNPATARVPWANEPGCGSCHTGDAMDNKASSPATLANPVDVDGEPDGIRLLQAFLTSDTKAKPIVPSNTRFAENTVETGPASGNPMLYRASTGHEGIFCEACHGSTHSIWPAANPNANDNVAANQAQGHPGKVIECDTCHTGSLGNTLDGPHGMHAVGTSGQNFADGGHEDVAEHKANECRACHGKNGQGTVLSKAAVDRSFTIEKCEKGSLCPGNEVSNFTVNLKKGDVISCALCHKNKLN